MLQYIKNVDSFNCEIMGFDTFEITEILNL